MWIGGGSAPRMRSQQDRANPASSRVHLRSMTHSVAWLLANRRRRQKVADQFGDDFRMGIVCHMAAIGQLYAGAVGQATEENLLAIAPDDAIILTANQQNGVWNLRQKRA